METERIEEEFRCSLSNGYHRREWTRHLIKQLLYSHLHPIAQAIQVRRTRHAGICWRSKEKLMRNNLIWIPTLYLLPIISIVVEFESFNNKCTDTYFPSHKPSNQGKQAMLGTAGDVRMNSYVTFTSGLLHTVTLVFYKLRADTVCRRENLPGSMADWDGWQDRVEEFLAISSIWP